MATRTLTSELVVSLLDKVTGPAASVSASIKGIGAAIRDTNSVSLTDRLAAASARNSAALSKARGEMSGAVMNAFMLGGALGYPLAQSAKFRLAMNNVAAVSGATAKQFKQMGDQALLLGRNTQYTATQTADAEKFLAMSGMKAANIMTAIPKVLQLAASAQLDLGTSADIVTNIMHGYGIEASNLGHVNDVLVKSFTSANTNLEQLGVAFRYGGPVAHAAGLSFEQTAAALSMMGNAGIQASMAGTSLRGAITRMLNPTKQVREAMAQYNLTFKDAHGALLPLDQIIKELEPHAKDAGLMMRLFGLRAGPGMMVLVQQGHKAMEDFTATLKASGGTAEKIANVQMKGLMGQWRFMTSSVNNLAIAIGDALTPRVQVLLSKLGDLANSLFDIVRAHQKVVVAIAGIATALLGLKVASVAARIAFYSMKGGLLSILTPGAQLVTYLAGAAKGSIELQASLAAMSGLRFTGLAVFTTGLRGMLLAIPGVSALAEGLGAVGAAIAGIAAAIGAPAIAVGAVVVAGLVGTGVLIYKYWRPLGAFFTGVADGIGSALAPAITAARPLLNFLGDAGARIGKAFSGAWRWFQDWIGASPATPGMLTSWKNAGKMLGEAIVSAILYPFQRVYDAIKGIAGYVRSVLPSLDFGSHPNALTSAPAGAKPQSMSDFLNGLPKRAGGGPVSRDKAYQVGEMGPEVLTGTDGYVHRAGSAPQAPSGPVTVSPSFHLHFNGVGDWNAIEQRLRDFLNREYRNVTAGLLGDLGFGGA